MIEGGLTCNKSKTYLWKIVSSYLLGALSTTNLIQEKETWNYTFPDIWKTQRRGAYVPSRCYVDDQGSTMIKFINIHQVSPLQVIHVRYSGYFIVKAFLSIKLIFLLWIDSLVYFHK